MRSCWQEFVFVGQSLPAAKSVWEVGATEADWELRATSTPTSTIHHLPPSPSLNSIFFGMFQDIFKGCFHPHIHNPTPPALTPSYPISCFFRIVSTLAPSLTSKVSAEEMFRKYEFLHNNSCQESVAEQYCNIFCKFCPPFSFWMSVALEKEAIELLTLAADKHRRIPTTADMCSFA